jgi:NSS family neurotransmitter:Na+ symporter
LAHQPKTAVFGTRYGFYLAAIGSAFGLGNLWRFPYVVVENGGGAFVLLYLFLVFLIGMPLLIAELSLGKISRNGLSRALTKLRGEAHQIRDLRADVGGPTWLWAMALRWLGRWSVMITLVVLAYYAVISGWVLHFFMQLLVALLTPRGFEPTGALQMLLDNGWLQILLAGVHIGVVAIIVTKEFEMGMEKWVGYVMPVFVILLSVLAYQALQLPSAGSALRFLFYPDFSRLTLASLGQAVGHVLFTLSVGFGSMVTFGSYLRPQSYIPMAGLNKRIK